MEAVQAAMQEALKLPGEPEKTAEGGIIFGQEN
jgi:hypothetical protein